MSILMKLCLSFLSCRRAWIILQFWVWNELLAIYFKSLECLMPSVSSQSFSFARCYLSILKNDPSSHTLFVEFCRNKDTFWITCAVFNHRWSQMAFIWSILWSVRSVSEYLEKCNECLLWKDHEKCWCQHFQLKPVYSCCRTFRRCIYIQIFWVPVGLQSCRVSWFYQKRTFFSLNILSILFQRRVFN